MDSLPLSVQQTIQEISLKLCKRPKLQELFKNYFPNTLETTTKLLEDGTTYIFTGDIPAMWLRDSSAQVRQYIKLAPSDSELQRIIEGLIKRQIMYKSIDPYANAFNEEANDRGHEVDITEQNPWVWERKLWHRFIMMPEWCSRLLH